MTTSMSGLRLYGPDDLRLEEMPRPKPGPGEALVKVAAVGICGTDLELLAGTHGALLTGVSTYPIIPGHEWSGYVVELGEGVERFQVGDLVVGETGIGCLRCRWCLTGHHQLCPRGTETGIIGRPGAMREYHVQNADFLHRFPVDDPELAALAEPASVGLYACRKSSISPLDLVAIVGGGTIGQFCLQAARVCGARYTMLVTRSEPKLQVARELGADLAVSSAETDLMALAADVTSGELFDVVIEAAGTAEALSDALQLGGYTSRIGIVGYSSRAPFTYSLGTLIDREQTLIGVRGSPHVYPRTVELLAGGQIQGHPLISHRFSLGEHRQAFNLARQGGPDVLKVLLKP